MLVGYTRRMKTHAMPTHKLQYSSYLVRIWRPTPGDGCARRIALEDLETGERLGFTNLDSLFAILDTRLTAEAGDDTDIQGKPTDS